MIEEEKILKFISDIEQIRDGHSTDAILFNLNLDWHQRMKTMHEAKAAAYDFVIRKLKRTFNLNNGK